MTDTTKHPEFWMITLLLIYSTVDWMADCFFSLF